jgi:hypothetical protein
MLLPQIDFGGKKKKSFRKAKKETLSTPSSSSKPVQVDCCRFDPTEVLLMGHHLTKIWNFLRIVSQCRRAVTAIPNFQYSFDTIHTKKTGAMRLLLLMQSVLYPLFEMLGTQLKSSPFSGEKPGAKSFCGGKVISVFQSRAKIWGAVHLLSPHC